jgi:hypothetical protein
MWNCERRGGGTREGARGWTEDGPTQAGQAWRVPGAVRQVVS